MTKDGSLAKFALGLPISMYHQLAIWQKPRESR